MSDNLSSVESVGTALRPLRIWPVIVLLVGMVGARLAPLLIEDGPANLWMVPFLVPLLCSLLIVVWWLAISRASWRERLTGFVGFAVILALTLVLVAPSMRGPATLILTVPLGAAAFAVGAILGARRLTTQRTWVALLLALCGFGFSTLLQAEGMWGNYSIGLRWRWQPSPEDQMMVAKQRQASAESVAPSELAVQLPAGPPEWPGFRGADRSSRQRGTTVAVDWAATPPELMWKVAVGPAWSSFAVAGKWLFTQEQRGGNEVVVCYDAESGQEVWTQQIEGRFDDPLGGPGPRATPTLADGGLFVLGALGHLLRLDPADGQIVWQQDLREVASRQPPMWGFSSSPLVIAGHVIVHAGGEGDRGTLAFGAEQGDLRWSVAAGSHTYSSPQLAQIAGEQVVMMLTNTSLDLLDPQTGADRLRYSWPVEGYRTLQPQVLTDDALLIPTGMGVGTRRIRITQANGAWAAEEVWTSRHLKPDFNDFVVYQDHAFGFDGAIFTCIRLDTGERTWKGGRYGKGQVLLLQDAELLLITSEQGEVVLLKADATEHVELGRIQALDGKTWNHPVVVGDRLYVRNSEAAACWRLPGVAAAPSISQRRQLPIDPLAR